LNTDTYQILEILTKTPLEEFLSSIVFELGALGMEMVEGSLRIYFQNHLDLARAMPKLSAFLEEIIGKEGFSFKIWELKDPGWELEWRKYFEPQWVGESLLVLAPWHTLRPMPNCDALIMDPGPAFGTGRHATTKMCLMALKEIRGLYQDPWTVLDVGTGSGILAIYAALLGAANVVALDVDEDALLWAKRNLALNGVAEKVSLGSVPIQSLGQSFHTIVANITCEVILELMPFFIKKLKKGGAVILSGILEGELNQLLTRAYHYFLDVYSVSYQGEWVCVCLKRS